MTYGAETLTFTRKVIEKIQLRDGVPNHIIRGKTVLQAQLKELLYKNGTAQTMLLESEIED